VSTIPNTTKEVITVAKKEIAFLDLNTKEIQKEIPPIPQKEKADIADGKHKKIIIKSFLAAGDITVLTAAVRDLKKAHGDRLSIDVRTSCPSLWENNPHLTRIKESQADIVVDAHYPLVNNSNQYAYHFIHGYALNLEKQLGLRIPITDFKGDVHISQEEKQWISQIEQHYGRKDKFWIIDTGIKWDFTSKASNPKTLQKVVSHFKDVLFVQTGMASHFHPRLKGDNVIDLVGKTNLREMVRLMYHAVGVITPISFPMHLAAAVESPYTERRPCIVLAGGREPRHWEQYPNHVYFDKVGQLSCCKDRACWKTRCTIIKDGDDERNASLCENRVFVRKAKNKKEREMFDEFYVPKCIDDIKAKDIIEAMNNYYDAGGAVR